MVDVWGGLADFASGVLPATGGTKPDAGPAGDNLYQPGLLNGGGLAGLCPGRADPARFLQGPVVFLHGAV
ncbi:hypothetical protein AB0X45_07915 [Limosilactobacillus reuteri]